MTDVVFLVARIDSKTGGMERQALQLASALQRNGCQIFFVTCAYWGWMRTKGLGVKGTVGAFPVYRVPIFRGWRRLNACLYWLGALFFLVLSRSHYNIIHAHELHSSGVIACFGKILMASKRVVIKAPSLGERIGDLAALRRLPASRFFLSLVLRKADLVVGVTAAIRRELEDAGFTRVTAIPNGVDTVRFCPPSGATRQRLKAELLGGRENLPVVLFVGRLGQEKNLPVLLKSVQFLTTRVLLLVIGEGSQRTELETLAEQLPDYQQVMFWGAAERVERFFQVADVFVLPSFSEGLPNVLLEAMSCGVASIGSDIPGIAAVIDDGVNGCLFRQGAEELTIKLDQVLADEKYRNQLSRKARETVLERFSIGTIANKYQKLYLSSE